MGEQPKGDEAIPGRPGPHLILVQSHFALGRGLPLFDSPPAVAYPYYLGEWRSFWTICQIVSQIPRILLETADQQRAAPASRTCPRERKTGPVVRRDRLALSAGGDGAPRLL